jgi:hypothetical protein
MKGNVCYCWAIILLVAAGGTGNAARIAWERPITNLALTTLIADNLGHVAAVGSRDGRGSIVLLDSNGNVIATTAFCLAPGAWAGPKAAADTAGRIFVAFAEDWGALLHVNRFEPLLGAMSRLTTMQRLERNTYTISGVSPDDNGGLFICSRWEYFNQGPRTVVHHYGCDGYSRFGQSRVYGLTAMMVRAPNGNIYHIADWGWPRLSQIEVIVCSPDGSVRADDAFGVNEAPRAAVCDSSSSLLILGSSGPPYEFPWTTPFLLKINPQGTVVWRKDLPSEFLSGTLAIDPSDHVILVGDTNTVNLDSDGKEIWRAEATGAVRVQRSDGTILSRAMTQDDQPTIELTKLAWHGAILWRTNYQFAANIAHQLSGFILNSDDIYLAVHLGQGSDGRMVVAKITEEDGADSTGAVRSVIEAPLAEGCEPSNVGPCDHPPPPPPKPALQLDVTRIRGAKMVCCWLTNYPEYTLQATRRLRPNHPEKEKWLTVTNLPTASESSVCVTNRILRWGRNYRLVKP